MHHNILAVEAYAAASAYRTTRDGRYGDRLLDAYHLARIWHAPPDIIEDILVLIQSDMLGMSGHEAAQQRTLILQEYEDAYYGGIDAD